MNKVTPDYVQDIGWAVRKLKDGVAVRRRAWFDGWAHLFLVPAAEYPIGNETMRSMEHIMLRVPRPGGESFTITPYTATQEDILTRDWELAPKRSSIVIPEKELII